MLCPAVLALPRRDGGSSLVSLRARPRLGAAPLFAFAESSTGKAVGIEGENVIRVKR